MSAQRRKYFDSDIRFSSPEDVRSIKNHIDRVDYIGLIVKHFRVGFLPNYRFLWIVEIINNVSFKASRKLVIRNFHLFL